MMFATTRIVGILAATALAFVGFALPAEAAPSYTFGKGSMLTIEYEDGDAPLPSLASTTSKVGVLLKSGKVRTISRDLGLSQITDAEYATSTGLVYVLASGYVAPCQVWSFDPAKIDRSITKVADVRANGVVDANSDGCGSIAIVGTTAYISFSSLDSTACHYRSFDISNNFAPVQQWTTADWYFANVISSGGVGYTVAPVTNGTTLETWNGPNDSQGTVEIHPLASDVSVHSLRFDGRGNLWAAAWMDDGVYVGRVDLADGATSWGPLLKEARGNSPWLTDTIVFVPKSAMH